MTPTPRRLWRLTPSRSVASTGNSSLARVAEQFAVFGNQNGRTAWWKYWQQISTTYGLRPSGWPKAVRSKPARAPRKPQSKEDLLALI